MCPSLHFELKNFFVDHLVQLLSCGHVLPVVDYVAHCMELESLDQSHIVHNYNIMLVYDVSRLQSVSSEMSYQSLDT